MIKNTMKVKYSDVTLSFRNRIPTIVKNKCNCSYLRRNIFKYFESNTGGYPAFYKGK